MAAEVANLQRSVVITGDDFSAEGDSQHVGLHTIMAGGGAMKVEYARVEKCGQRHRVGRYCLHWHYLFSCPDCVFRGNAIEDSHQGGITVHQTHDALVEDNVLWDTRGNGTSAALATSGASRAI